MWYIHLDWFVTWSEFRMRVRSSQESGVRGVALAALLITLTIMQIMMALALPQWEAWVQREKELELIWRGEQYAQAIMYYYAKYRAYPPSIDILVQQHFLRKKYKEPFHPEGKWDILRQGQRVSSGKSVQSRQQKQKQPSGQRRTRRGPSKGTVPTAGELQTIGPIIGVRSLDPGEAIIKYKGGTTHNSWLFVFNPQQLQRRQVIQGQPRQQIQKKQPPRSFKKKP